MEAPPLAEDELAYDHHDYSHLYLLNDKSWNISPTNAWNIERIKLPHIQFERHHCMCLISSVMIITLILCQGITEYATFLITDGILVRIHIQ
jgi:hypothetical protein